MNIEYLKKIEFGKKNSDKFIIKPISSTLGAYDPFPGLKTPFQRIDGEISFPRHISGYSYEDFLDEFDNMLLEKGHIFSEQIVVALTFLFLHIRDKELTTQAAWRLFKFSYFTTCKLHLEFPTEFVLSQDEPILNLKDYEIGCFDFETMKNKISRYTQSDFALLLAQSQNFNFKNFNYLSFKRIEENCSIFNVIKILSVKYFPRISFKAYADIYFEAQSAALFEQFWEDLEQQQTVSVALGGAYYDLTWLREFNIGKGIQIAIYTHIDGDSKQGWVIPIDPRLTSINIDSKTRPEELNNKIKDYYEKLDETETPFVNLIKVLTDFVAQGNKLLFQNKINEAFLNFWIGLDAVLNDDDKLAQSKLLKKRVALLSFSKSGRDYFEHLNYIEEMYKLRSGLVHAGKPVNRQKANEICRVAEFVIENLFRAHTNAKTNGELTINYWYKNMDDLIHLLTNNAKPEKTKHLLKFFDI